MRMAFRGVRLGAATVALSLLTMSANRMKADLLAAYMTGSTVAPYLSDSNCTVSELMLGGW